MQRSAQPRRLRGDCFLWKIKRVCSYFCIFKAWFSSENNVFEILCYTRLLTLLHSLSYVSAFKAAIPFPSRLTEMSSAPFLSHFYLLAKDLKFTLSIFYIQAYSALGCMTCHLIKYFLYLYIQWGCFTLFSY